MGEGTPHLHQGPGRCWHVSLPPFQSNLIAWCVMLAYCAGFWALVVRFVGAPTP